MNNLFGISEDGACAASRAVRAHLSGYSGIEESWSSEWKRYMAEPEINRWHNCREQGYVISMHSQNYSRQLNIAFFEHRNSDNICAIKWEQKTWNPPTIDNAEFGDIYKDKYDVSHQVSYNQAYEMSEWIYEQLVEFWKVTSVD